MYKLQGSRLSCGQGWMAALAWARGVALGAQPPERDLHHPHLPPALPWWCMSLRWDPRANSTRLVGAF